MGSDWINVQRRKTQSLANQFFALASSLPQQGTPAETSRVLSLARREDVQESNDIPEVRTTRGRRWIWTDALTDITGLAAVKDIQRLEKNENRLAAAEQGAERQIQELTKRTGQIVADLRNSSHLLTRLFRDESELEGKLQLVLADEQSVEAQLAALAETMEVTAHANMAFHGILSAARSLEDLVQALEGQVQAVARQEVPVGLLPEAVTFSEAELAGAKVSIQLEPSTAILLHIPRGEDFTAFRVEGIPFTLEDGVGHALDLGGAYAKGPENRTFRFQAEECAFRRHRYFCSAQRIVFKKSASTCAEALLVTDTMPDVCLSTMKVSKVNAQHAVRTPGGVNIYSPELDQATFFCDGDRPFVRPVPAGASFLALPTGCAMETTELRIISSSQDSVEPSDLAEDWVHNWAEDAQSLLEHVTAVSGVNLTKLATHMRGLNRSFTAEKLDLQSAAADVDTWRSLQQIEDFHPLNPQLENATPMSLTVHGLGGVMVLAAFVAITRCAVKACCPGVICSALGAVLLWPFKAMARFFKWACSAEAQDTVEIGLEKTEDSVPAVTYRRAPVPTPRKQRLVWTPRMSAGRWLLTADVKDGLLYFNHLTGAIENSDGNVLRLDDTPHPDVLQAYLKLIAAQPPPALIRDEAGRLVVESDPDVVFDDARNQYRHKRSGKVVYGYKLPDNREPLYAIPGASPDPGTPKSRRNRRSSSSDSGKGRSRRTRSRSRSSESVTSHLRREARGARTRSRSPESFSREQWVEQVERQGRRVLCSSQIVDK